MELKIALYWLNILILYLYISMIKIVYISYKEMNHYIIKTNNNFALIQLYKI